MLPHKGAAAATRPSTATRIRVVLQRPVATGGRPCRELHKTPSAAMGVFGWSRHDHVLVATEAWGTIRTRVAAEDPLRSDTALWHNTFLNFSGVPGLGAGG